MDSYMITRQDAADTLEISVRSIDRYIKSWKIRSEKKWKKVYVHTDDINNMQLWHNEVKHVIVSEDTITKENTERTIKRANEPTIIPILAILVIILMVLLLLLEKR